MVSAAWEQAVAGSKSVLKVESSGKVLEQRVGHDHFGCRMSPSTGVA